MRAYDKGSIVGDHELEERLGAGGFGEVWRARRLPDGDGVAVPGEPVRVALKIAAEPNRARQLAREAKLAASLDHPGVVKTYRVRLDSEPPHLVLQLIRGTDLRRRLRAKGGKLPWQEAVRTLADAVDAVAHAHKRGVVHGDIKPENILVEWRSGGVFVTDFGLGRELDAGGQSLALSFSRSVQGVAGTLAYMAPEMLEGTKANKSTDVYALAAVLYEMVTGSPPAGAFLLPSEMDFSLPDELDRVLDRALDGDPAARYNDAAALKRAMAGLIKAAGPDPRKKEVKKSTPTGGQVTRAGSVVSKEMAEKAANKPRKYCPRCKDRLRKARYCGVSCRGCPSCRGVWLERRSLEGILDRWREEETEPIPTTVPPGLEDHLVCVECKKPMEKLLIGAGSVAATLIDLCRGHGVWFDPGEVERAYAVFARSPVTLTTVLARLSNTFEEAKNRKKQKKSGKAKS